MRSPEIGRALRRLERGQAEWNTVIERLFIQGVPAIGAADLLLGKPLIVLAGANGAGKTALLRCLWAALDPEAAAQSVRGDGRLTNAQVRIDLNGHSGPMSASVSIEADGIVSHAGVDIEATHIDSGRDSLQTREDLRKFNSADDIINGVAPLELSVSELREVNFITCRDYRSISLYEVDLGYTAPFFRVTLGHTNYDSRSMGLGESAAFFLWWSLRRAADDSVILIEEPEAFLSHASQANFTAHLFKIVGEKKLTAIVASHAPALIESSPQGSLIMATRLANGAGIQYRDPHPTSLKALGIEPSLRCIGFVEDSVAAMLCRSILERVDPPLSRSVHIERRGGAGEVTRSLSALKGLKCSVAFVGVYDGDQRGSVPEELLPCSVFLPGNTSFEALLRDAALAKVAELQVLLGGVDVATVLANLGGKDPHDWFLDFARGLGITPAELFGPLFSTWVADGGNADLCRVFCSELRTLLENGGW